MVCPRLGLSSEPDVGEPERVLVPGGVLGLGPLLRLALAGPLLLGEPQLLGLGLGASLLLRARLAAGLGPLGPRPCLPRGARLELLVQALGVTQPAGVAGCPAPRPLLLLALLTGLLLGGRLLGELLGL